MEAYRSSIQRRRRSVVRMLTPLLLGVGCVVPYRRWRDPRRVIVQDAPLLYFNLAFRLTSSTSYRCVKFKFSTIFDGWLGSRVVSMLDSGAVGPGFKSQPRRCRVTVLSNCSHRSCLCSPSSEIGSSPPKGCDGNCGPGGK